MNPMYLRFEQLQHCLNWQMDLLREIKEAHTGPAEYCHAFSGPVSEVMVYRMNLLTRRPKTRVHGQDLWKEFLGDEMGPASRISIGEVEQLKRFIEPTLVWSIERQLSTIELLDKNASPVLYLLRRGDDPDKVIDHLSGMLDRLRKRSLSDDIAPDED